MTTLSADRPSTNPTDDLYGHAPFAESIARSIVGYRGTDGLVLSLYGPWGSGKSTVISYVQHYLEQHPEADRPVIVAFNPWWFSGQDDLARAFLGQLQAVFTSSEKLKEIAESLGQFAVGLGGLADLSGITAGMGKASGEVIAHITKRTPTDLSKLKKKINDLLIEANTRVLVIADDIDRLMPDETRQLFTVIKGLADFPNVIYLLAFDREVVSKAIEQQSGLPGERYLEKIIQVPLELPITDRLALRNAFIKRLNAVMGDDELFNKSYWGDVFHYVDTMIRVPRDVIRLINTLSVTYPALRGEVNPVDFIALEAIRVFHPALYDLLRSSRDALTGEDSSTQKDREAEAVAFRAKCAAVVPLEFKTNADDLLTAMFPKLGLPRQDWKRLGNFRLERRACHPEIFEIYFRFSILDSGWGNSSQ
jgi:predicted KAP-like P-loop ATPase